MDKKKSKGKQEAAECEALPEEKQAPAENVPAEEAKKSEAVPKKSETELALDRALAEAEEFKRKWYAIAAEYENYRKRSTRENATRYADGRADVIKGLFPIADNLDRAYAACTDEATGKGIRMVLEAFKRLLEKEHVTVIDPVGERFDAEKHEAIMAVDPADGEESGTVRQVYLKGYEQNGKVLRFAQVVVVK